MKKKKSENQKYTTVSIPKPLYEKIKKIVERTGFTSVSDYVVFVLREIVSTEEAIGNEGFSKESEKEIKNKLKALGYIEED